MRPVTLADLEVAVRAIVRHPQEDREAFAVKLLGDAAIADSFRAKTGKLHPSFGAGTLMSAAMQHPLAARPEWAKPETLAALGFVLKGLDAKYGQSQNVK
ncbi:DUF7742 family protein [Yoonia litorea]|uniref:DUF7742 domain-containing protein n=1 Tax=Yoonia litorea TaxID=1123755 RepID=A0A1I6LXK4_9RHOB|nr:hypothetical protein [Yoonia litorea]SFS08150.1 hypothetical protein SAMN05444714_0993 [Yoonia litorea]